MEKIKLQEVLLKVSHKPSVLFIQFDKAWGILQSFVVTPEDLRN